MSRHRTRRDHRRTKSPRQKQQRHYKLVGQTVALTVALATSNAMPQEADKRETFTLPPQVDVQDQRNPLTLRTWGYSDCLNRSGISPVYYCYPARIDARTSRHELPGCAT